ncbi:hypothetical protein E3P99_00692 [Wallemia hederae]|uniref:Histone-lysine N-methyltransferase, H3 lysine-36 specific n=1 Tax=Wallemia hederae TaxID=1540922 RepID=A0A4T0FU34_9BASI|nr:hypothetical protein E3P99_00692 [Wallemia hederae]
MGTPIPMKKSPLSEDATTGTNGLSTPISDADNKEKEIAKAVLATAGKPNDQSHLPVASEALESFDILNECHYANKSLGRSRQNVEESYCDCYMSGGACSHNSDCINRLTQVECLLDDCRSGPDCHNQRFQRRQWAGVDVVQTEKKGYGLRAKQDLDRDTFLIEYIGEVVTQTQFLRRMNTYAKEGIRHFYFMMLQNEEFIDATRKGNIGRFANHSCAPNCFVSKWVVGKYVKMGIFTKRKIYKGEELTFNYNVDRYGHDAQECYCGEPNCVGYIGGKTQTDIGGMDDQILDALGISQEEVMRLALRGNKKKKSKKLDEDYELELKPMVIEDVPKVITAVRQSSTNKKILIKLLKRMRMTESHDIQRQLMRMHGFAIQASLLSEYPDDEEIDQIWSQHLKVKNKIETSKIDEPVTVISGKTENEEMKAAAKSLLQLWDTLESAYRIPKRGLNQTDDDILLSEHQNEHLLAQLPEAKRARLNEDPLFKSQKEFVKPEATVSGPPTEAPTLLDIQREKWKELQKQTSQESHRAEQQNIQKIIEQARIAEQIKQDELAKQKAEEEAEKQKKREIHEARKAAKKEKERKDKEREKERERKEREQRRRNAEKEKERERKEKEKESASDPQRKLHKQIGELVVNFMSKSKDSFSHDSFKKHAKELTTLLLEKEKKKGGTEMSEDVRNKMKKFIKEYVNKILARKQSKQSKDASAPENASGSVPSEKVQW